MPRPIAKRCLEIVGLARTRVGELFRFDPARLPFSLGSSFADVRVPVQVSPEAVDIVRAAARQLALLLATHHRHFIPSDDHDRVLLMDGCAALPTPTRTLGPARGGNPDLRAAALIGPASHPALTGGIVSAWMGPGGRGRSLTALVIQSLEQAFREMDPETDAEQTPIIVALALARELQSAQDDCRDILSTPAVGHYLGAATSVGLWVAADTGLNRAWRKTGRGVADPLFLRLAGIMTPGSLLGQRGAPIGGATVYGCELWAPIPHMEEIVSGLTLGGDADAALGAIRQALASDQELSRRAETAVALSQLRELLLSGIAGAEEAGPAEGMTGLREIYTAPGLLASACADNASRWDLVRRVQGAARFAGPGAGTLMQAATAIGAWRPLEPGSAFGLGREAARNEYVAAAGAAACDAAVHRLLAPAWRALWTRTGKEFEGGAHAEWEGGRLYRISARAGPILKPASQQLLGHLFADVKDFTRRTGLLGPATMGEFLRTEFYGPILSSAKEFFLGMPHLADRGGVSVNNLLGDAISFTGAIEIMVALAAAIRRLLTAYGTRLAREVSNEAVARQLRALEERFEQEIARLRAEREEAEHTARNSPAQSREALKATSLAERIAEQELRVGQEHVAAIARARGEGLEASVFLSFGPAPVTVIIEDDVFGSNRVAVAEKINESARGTARTASARATADAALASERARRGVPELEHAWSVFIGSPLTIQVPPGADQAAIDGFRAGDMTSVVQALTGPIKEALTHAAREQGDAPGDIYNCGAALSEEALMSFLDAVKEERLLRRIVIELEEIPDALRARWYYGNCPLELVATYTLDGRPAELFRRAGRASFKGLGDVVVWEIADDSGGPGALFRHFGLGWRDGGSAPT